ncbi:ATP-binding protein [Streptomyces sp. BI20]|uniref:ATP-binding protein n=1 Tax=Streptomyces sp. BI20 TaxID=3403460 RepID=UPI003C7147D9
MPGNLPQETATFVGREEQLALLDAVLPTRRLISLVGVGGVGKSRLALRALSRDRRHHRPDGVWWVDLSPLRDPALLTATVAHALGLTEHTTRSPDEELCGHLADKRALIVLDTCEHLVTACRHLIGELLQSAPHLTVLVTTREPLGNRGEHLVPVPPLPTDGPHSEAMRLLRARTLAHPGRRRADLFEDPRTRAVAGDICRRLDGIPLAIELAGARLHEWTVDQMAHRLRTRFDVLAGDSPDALPRHRTLRTTIGWSHELCAPLERLLWARLSVFTGDFDLGAARAVCAGGPLSPHDVDEVLDALVAKSVVHRTEEGAAGPRYRLLDTIREYGHEWLDALGEAGAVADRHAHWYAALAHAADMGWLGPAQLDWHRRMTADHPQLRTALDHLLATDPPAALAMAGALWFLWFCCGHTREGRRRLERALDLAPREGPAHTQAMWALGITALLQGDLGTAHDWARRCEAAARDGGHPERRLRAAYLHGFAVLMPGDPALALRLSGPAAHLPLGGRADGVGRLMCRLVTGYALCDLGRFEEAAAEARVLREACVDLDEHWLRAYADYVLAVAALRLGHPEEAARHVRAMLGGKRLLGDRIGIALGLDLLAAATAAQGDGATAARLLGTGHAWWRTIGLPQMNSPSLKALRDEGERRARAGIGDRAFEAAYTDGTKDPAY